MPNRPNADSNDKPALLRAIEVILADPKSIKEAAVSLHEEYKKRYAGDRVPEEMADLVGGSKESHIWWGSLLLLVASLPILNVSAPPA
jgi:hypothetical protein